MKTATVGQSLTLNYSGNEALNTICSNLNFAGRNIKKIVITSCNAGEGKSYMTMQIASNLAKRGKRVVIVDGDLRKSFIIKKYGLETEGEWIGLAHYLVEYNTMDEIIYRLTNLYDVCFIPIGRDVANPVQLLDTNLFPQLLDKLAQDFDLVLVDAPPIGIVIDAAEIAQSCDGAVFVIEYNKTRRKDILDAKKQLTQANCPILGAVVNKVTFESLGAKKYYNRSYYSHYTNEYYRRSSKKSSSDDKKK
ncbi:MAG: CpsD/CapB family tyrosine-protein kinase [Clostridia bacterium]|nr:CpsD/CapB family tyrosine-protein kinase [Clostridia bacterium]